MDSLLKALAVVVPFIGRCPTWFQVAVFAWLVLTAVLLIVGFVLGIQQPSSSTPGPESLQAATASSAAAFPPSVVPEVTAFAILQPLAERVNDFETPMHINLVSMDRVFSSASSPAWVG